MEIHKAYCLVCGKGKDAHKIGSFDSALIDAGVGNYNLVKVSSILPPGSQCVNSISADPGSVLYTAYISETTRLCEKIAVAVAVAIPEDKQSCGVIIKYSLRGSKHEAEKAAVMIARNAMDKRGIFVTQVKVISAEILGDDSCYSTVFAGLVLLEQNCVK